VTLQKIKQRQDTGLVRLGDEMKINEILETNFIDNKDGWGAVPDNQEIDYKGLRVLMRPSVFLSLATKLHNIESADRIKSHLKSGGKIGAPFLIVDIIDDDIPQIIGHDGRNRMIAIMRLQGDSPIEVHIFPIGMRRKHMTDEMIQHLNSGAKKEKSSRVIDGPLFELIDKNLAESRIGTAIHLNSVPEKYRKLPLLGRGATSLVYDAGDTVILLTRDQMKKEWIDHSDLGNLIDVIDVYHPNRDMREMPVYIYRMQKLFELDKENKKKVRKMVKKLDEIRWRMPILNRKEGFYRVIQKMMEIVDLEFSDQSSIREFLDFIIDYDEKQYVLDFLIRNFMQDADGKIIATDPVVSKELMNAFMKLKRPLNELSKPSYRNEAVEILQSNGYNHLGSGKFADVFQRKSRPNEVIKLFDSGDEAYIDYLEFIMRNQDNPHFPKVFGKPMKITPDYYVVKLEKLESYDIFRDGRQLVNDISKFLRRNPGEDYQSEEEMNEIEAFKNYLESFPKFKEALEKLMKFENIYDFDIHAGNLMWRKNTLVLSDPIMPFHYIN
jgi:hypothetical protein